MIMATLYEQESFDTEQEATQESARLRRAFYGYDPTVRVYQDMGGLWIVAMTRSSSCD
jgi:hypothetical protein